MLPTWSVTTLTRNTTADFCRYVAWYLDQGASRIHLYFHDPNDPNIALVEHNERVEVTRLTPALMEELESSDDKLAQIQSNIGPHAYRRATTDWMLRCDIDELIHIPGDRKLADLLAQINPKEVDSIRIEMAEVLQSGRTGSAMRFGTEIPQSELEAVYGDVGPLLATRLGLIGHRRGKAITRTGVPDALLRTHAVRYLDPAKRPRELLVKMLAPVRLLHFNSSTLQNWMGSLHYRLEFSSFDPELNRRLRQLRADGEAGAMEIERIYRIINDFDDDRFQYLVDHDHGFEVSLDIDALVSRYFPSATI